MDGQVWVAAQAAQEDIPFSPVRAAITVSPETLSAWRQSTQLQMTIDGSQQERQLAWLEAQGHTPQTDVFLQIATVMSALDCAELPEELNAILQPCIAPERHPSESYQSVLVSGLPGCGAMELAKALSKVMRVPLCDMATIWDGQGVGPMQILKLHEWLQTNALEGAILCDVMQDPVEVLQACAFQGLQLVSHIVSVVDPFIAYPWGAARHPVLLSRTARGWVNGAFVQDCLQKPSPSKVGHEHRALCALLLKELHSSRCGEQVSMRPLTGDIIEGALKQDSSPYARFLSRPGHWIGSGLPELFRPQAKLWRCFVPVSSVLDFEVLKNRCAGCLRKADDEFVSQPERSSQSPSVWKGLFCVEAKAHGVVGSSFWALPSTRLEEAARTMEGALPKAFVLTAKGELSANSWQEPLSSKLGLVFWWCLFDAEVIDRDQLAEAASAEVAESMLQMPPQEEAWQVSTVPDAVKAEIAEEVRSEGPPDGYCFDGVRYISQTDCSISREHPCFAGRLANIVENHNSELAAREHLIQQVMETSPFGKNRLPSPVRPPGKGTRPSRGYQSSPAPTAV